MSIELDTYPCWQINSSHLLNAIIDITSLDNANDDNIIVLYGVALVSINIYIKPYIMWLPIWSRVILTKLATMYFVKSGDSLEM